MAKGTVTIGLTIEARLDKALKDVKALAKEVKNLKKAESEDSSADEGAESQKKYKKALDATTEAQKMGSRALNALSREAGLAAGSFGSLGRVVNTTVGSVKGLTHPLTIAAAAVAALTAAYAAGEKESSNYARALIMTGNAVGKTSDDLQLMARSISSGVGSQREAAQAIQMLVSTGQSFGSELQSYAEVAVKAQRYLGQSIEETVQQFEQLGRAPVQASQALNERMNYLTLTVLEQIRALEEQGRHQEAVTLAMNTYANTISSRSGQVVQNLGYIERAWNSIKFASEAAIDGMMSIGRAGTELDEMVKVQTKLSKNHENLQKAIARGDVTAEKHWRNQISYNQSLIDGYGERKRAEQKINEEHEKQLQVQKEGKKSSEQWVQSLEEALTPLERKNKELKKARENFDAMRKAGKDVSEADLKKVLKSIDDRYTPKTSGGGASIDQAAQAYQQQQISLSSQLVQTQLRLQNAQDGVKDSQTAATDALTVWLATNEQAQSLDSARVQSLKALAAEVDATTIKLQEAAEAQVRNDRIESGLQDIQIQWLQATGQAAEASALQIEQRFKQLRKDLEAAGNTSGLGMLDSLVGVQKAQTELQQLQSEAQRIMSQQSQQERTIQLRLQSGLISEFESRRQIVDLHKQTADQVDQLIPKMRELAELSQNPAALDYLEEMSLRMAELRQQTNEFLLAFGTVFEDAFGDMFDKLIDGTSNFKDALADFFVDMVKDMGRWAAQELALELKSNMMGLFSSGADLLGSAADAAGDASGTAAKTAETVASMEAATALTAMSATSATASAALDTFTAAVTAAAAAASSGGAADAALSIGSAAFSSGGWTGGGGKYQPAGIVHADEFVIRKEVVNQPGMKQLLAAINYRGFAGIKGLAGYSDGGLVAGSSMPSYVPQDRSTNKGGLEQVNVNIIDDPSRISEMLMSPQGKDAMKVYFARNGKEIKQLLGIN